MSKIEEKIVETKSCHHCSTRFDITDKDMEFLEKISPVFHWKKYIIPTPQFCRECRQKRRMSFRNEGSLYKRKCDATGRDIIAVYSPDKPYKVYNKDFWWSDSWDGVDYGREYDFSRWFFEQFSELMLEMPHLWTLQINCENSDYCWYSVNAKDSYFSNRAADSEKIYYTHLAVAESSNCFDSYFISACENSYELLNCGNCNWSEHCFDCENCFDIMYCENCISCDHCIGCVNLTNKSYYILNKEYSKEEYEIKKKELLENREDFMKDFLEHKNDFIFKENFNYNTQNCIWDRIKDSKNVYVGFNVNDVEDARYVVGAIGWANIMDGDFTYFAENSYNQLGWNRLQNILSCVYCSDSSDLSYSKFCFSCENLFGCIGLRNKKYCILNKQYTKEEYEKLIPKIIEKMIENWEWWEFFPLSISPFGYNETIANEYYPLKKSETQKQGFKWSDYEAPFPKVEKTIPAKKLPDQIKDIPDDIINWAVTCEVSWKPFRIIPQELAFYRKHNLPIPKRHPDQRHLDRINMRNPRKLFERSCDKCNKQIQTTYSPNRSEKVYCESCYESEIY